MSLEPQRRHLVSSLVAAGLGQDAAAAIASAICNGVQELRHSGEITHDSTPADMRFVTKTTRQQHLTNFDFRDDDPDHRRQRTPPSEDRPIPEPPPNVVTTTAPQQSQGVFRVAPGSLADATAAGDAVNVSVRSRVARQPPAGLPLAMLDQQTNTLVGKQLRVNAAADDARLRAEVAETAQDVAINMQLQNLAAYDVITDVDFIPSKGLRLTYKTITAWNERNVREKWIPTADSRVLTDIVDDLQGLRARTSMHTVFEATEQENTDPLGETYASPDVWFNVFRVGTFTGEWLKDTVKTVTQTYPIGGREVEVWNITRDIPETEPPGQERTVLWAPRYHDLAPGVDVLSDTENPAPNSIPVVTQNFALEIGGEPWTVPVTVLTSVSFDGAALTFYSRDIRVSSYGEESVALIIPVDYCPPAP